MNLSSPPRRNTFVPIYGQPYWAVLGELILCFHWKGDIGDRDNLKNDNCHRTLKGAIRARRRERELNKKTEEAS